MARSILAPTIKNYTLSDLAFKLILSNHNRHTRLHGCGVLFCEALQAILLLKGRYLAALLVDWCKKERKNYYMFYYYEIRIMPDVI